jgi:RHS repeat-associated protein
MGLNLIAQSPDHNYIHVANVKAEGVTDPALINDNNALHEIKYFDGLGRPDQIIQKQLSPNLNDIIQPVEYDQFGREAKQYLPFTDKSNGNFVNDWQTKIQSFYQNSGDKIVNTSYYYAKTKFEPSPLNRVTKNGAPGYDWQLDQHPVKLTYRASFPNEVNRIEKNSNGEWVYNPGLFYDVNMLVVTTITDENNNNTCEFKDKMGHVVMKESEIDASNIALTYYAYDAIGNLTLVVSPGGMGELKNIGVTTILDASFIDRWCYTYKYDYRNRMIEKKIPGAEKVKLVYDELDRLVMSQDGNMNSANQWLFTKYDVLGRPIQTGINYETSSLSQENMTTQISTYNSQQGNSMSENFDAATKSYSMRSYPNTGDPVNNSKILTETYYDRYDFIPVGFDMDYYNETDYDPTLVYMRVAGKVTGSKTLVLESNPDQFLYSVTYYDKFGRVIQSQSQNHLGGMDITTNRYDFIGNIQQSTRRHNNGVNNDIVESFVYEYDQAFRLQTTMHVLGPDYRYIMAENKYNELGQLVEKNHYTEREQKLQSVDYTYNVRGWLRRINKPNLNNDNTVLPPEMVPQPTESVSGLNLNSLTFAFSYYSGIKPYLEINCNDTKVLTIAEIANPNQTRTVNTDESELNTFLLSNIFHTEIVTSLQGYSGQSLTLDLKNFYIDADDEMEPVFDTLTTIVENELRANGISNEVHLRLLTDMAMDFIKKRTSILYFNEDNDDLFGMELYYTEGLTDSYMDNIVPRNQYNGNIAGMRWKVAGGQMQAYGYDYDQLNRLTKANYAATNKTNQWDETENRYGVNGSPGITYDLNGNITGLTRKGLIGIDPNNEPVFGIMDHLTYTYELNNKRSNQLRAVSDAAAMGINEGVDFKDNATSTEEYFYDNNGNMTRDDNKGISSITYNYLNLPREIIFGSPGAYKKITYLYDAMGTKLRKTVRNGGAQEIITHYVGNIIYNNLDLEYILTPEGRIAATEGGGIDHPQFYLNDHLGNVRATFVESATIPGKVELLQQNHYYPFGQELMGMATQTGPVNPYKYNGKELQSELGLQWYDYGARFYDPSLGRFTSVDPLAELSRRWSPYTYGLDNPMRFIDPDGMSASDFKDKDDNLVAHIDDGSNAVYQQTGSGTNLHYEFTEEYSNQGGKNEVTDKSVTSAIQEQQNLNSSNSSLQQDYNPQTQKYGGTHCNQATQNVEATAQSAINAQGNGKVDLVTPGRANDIAKNLSDNKYDAYNSVTQKDAETAASNGKLAIVAYQNPNGSGHVATLSVGENINKGTLANIGVKSSTGFVPLKGAKNAAFRTDHVVKYYIPK